MIEILTNIVDFITTLVGFVINTITSLIDLIALIPAQFSFLTTAIASLPPFLIPYCMLFITFTVITYIIGRKVD